MQKRSPHVVGRTVPGAPPSVDRRRRVPRATPPSRSPLRCVSAALDRLRTFGVANCTRVTHGAPGGVLLPTYHIPRAQPAHHFVRAHPRRPSSHAGRAWKPAPTVGGGVGRQTTLFRRTRLAPTPQSRRKAPRQLPFQGSRGVGGGGYLYASVYHDAETYVTHSPVRGGVPDAPRLRDRRAALDASVRLDRQHPRHQRRARLASASPRIQSRGHSPRTFVTGAPTFSVNQRRARRFQRQIHLVRRRTASAARAHLPQALQGRV